MAITNILKSKILATRDTTANWNANPSFIPKAGEIIVYTDRKQKTKDDGTTINIPGIKIGDGLAYLIDLPFINEDDNIGEIAEILNKHINTLTIHVSTNDRNSWDNKVSVGMSEETLIFSK